MAVRPVSGWSQGKPGPDSPALSHVNRRGEPQGALPRGHGSWDWRRRALNVSLRNLPLMPLPAIVHWKGNHWMVLYDVTEAYPRGRPSARVAQNPGG